MTHWFNGLESPMLNHNHVLAPYGLKMQRVKLWLKKRWIHIHFSMRSHLYYPQLHWLSCSCWVCCSLSPSTVINHKLGGTFVTVGHMSFHRARSLSPFLPRSLALTLPLPSHSFNLHGSFIPQKGFVVNLSLLESLCAVLAVPLGF